MAIKLICIDMDGTLYTKDKIILPSTIQAMQEIIHQGVHIAIVTGRPLNYIMAFQKKVSLDWIMSGGNGASLNIKEQLILHPIDRQDIEKILSYANQYHLNAFIKTQHTIYHNYQSGELFHYDDLTKDLPFDFQMHSIYSDYLLTAIQTTTDEFLKVIILGDHSEDVLACRHEIHKNIEVSTFSSDPHHFELSSKDADKGKAVKEIASLLHILPDEICCIGDSDNDSPMFDVCGIPIAMGNASDTIKEKSKFITLSYDEDGVGHALFELMKKKLI